MSNIRPKQPRVQLEPGAYEELRQQVLRRNGWRCQSCGSMSNLEVHHQEFRSHGGSDSELNLITLCNTCDRQSHRQGQTVTRNEELIEWSITRTVCCWDES